MIEAPADEAAAPAQPAAPGTSWPALGRLLFVDVAAVVRERLHLAALEGQQFVRAAVRLAVFAIVAALLGLSAWFVLVAAGVALLVDLGMPLALALAVAALLNVLGAFWAWALMRGQLSLMTFAATLRSLQFAGPQATAPAAGAAEQGAAESGGAAAGSAPASACAPRARNPGP